MNHDDWREIRGYLDVPILIITIPSEKMAGDGNDENMLGTVITNTLLSEGHELQYQPI